MGRNRKLWRFRLDDSTTLEVSATSDATRTQIRRRGRWSLVVGMLAVLAVVATVASASVWTDQQNYTPGSVVTISGNNDNGAGYMAGETVKVSVSGPNGWSSFCSGTADSTGAWSCQVTLSSDPSISVGSYSYTASGQDSGVTESGTFADAAANNVHFSTSGLPAGVSIHITGSVTNNGGKSATIDQTFNSPGPSGDTGTLAGTTFTYSGYPASVVTGGQTCTLDSTLPASGSTTGAAGDVTSVVGTYTCVTNPPANSASTVKTAAADANGSEGDTLTTSGAFQDQDGNNTLTVSKVSGDGTVTDNGNGSWSWSLATADNGSGTVVVQASDGSLTVQDSFDWSAANVAPTATFGNTGPVDEGNSFTLSLTNPYDPSSADTAAGFTYAFDCGDGSGYSAFGSSTIATCATTDNGTRSVGGKIKDKDGGVTEYTATVTINNVAPTATFNAPTAVNEGSNINLSLTNPSDPSSADTAAGFTYAFDCGDGSGYGGFSSTSTASCSTTDNGSRTVKGKIKDKDGGVTEYTASVTINNVAPTVSALTLGGATGTACTAGNSVTLDFSFSDPGVNDNPWAVDINWGDGTHTTYNASSQGAQTQRSHSYGPGSYTISVSVTDKDGGTGSNSSAAGAVSHLYNVNGILPPINADGTSNVKLGSTIPVKIKVTDCSGASVSGLAPVVNLAKISSPTDGTVNEVVSSSAADTGNTMRYDSTGMQYIFNLSTKRSQFNAGQDLTLGHYHLWITSPAFATVDAYFDILR